MKNSEKIKILKENITALVYADLYKENYIIEQAEKTAREMQIEISRGEIYTIVCNIINQHRTEDCYEEPCPTCSNETFLSDWNGTIL